MYFPCNAYMFDDGLQLASDPNHNHVLYYNHVWSWFPIGWSWFMIGFFSWFPIGRCWLLIGSSSLPIGSPCFPIGCSCFPFGVFPLRPLVFRFGPPVFRLGFSDSGACFPIGVFRFGCLFSDSGFPIRSSTIGSKSDLLLGPRLYSCIISRRWHALVGYCTNSCFCGQCKVRKCRARKVFPFPSI